MPGTMPPTNSHAARIPNGIGSKYVPQSSRFSNWDDAAPHTLNSRAAYTQPTLRCDHMALILLPFTVTMHSMSKLLIFRWWKAVLNVHERRLPVSIETAGRILDSLASGDDLLWPREQWPPMVLDGGLAPGSCGGHGLIVYKVSEHVPGRRVEFEFGPMARLRTFRGRHYFEVLPRGEQTILRHSIDVDTDFAT